MKTENIESIVREFTERLTAAVKQQVAALVAESIGTPAKARKPHPAKGKPRTPKPCPTCGTLNARTRFAYHCEAHTLAYLESKGAVVVAGTALDAPQ